MNGLQVMAHMSMGHAATMADLTAAYDMMQHYLKSVVMPVPGDTQVCHASHHGTQVCNKWLALPHILGLVVLCVWCVLLRMRAFL